MNPPSRQPHVLRTLARDDGRRVLVAVVAMFRILLTKRRSPTVKRITTTFTVVVAFVLLSVGTAWGQGGPPGRMARADSMMGPRLGMMHGDMMGRGMMHMVGGMHRQMMQNPMHRSMMTAFALPAMADTLGLSEDQVAQLEDLRSEMQTQRQKMHQEMRANRQGLMDLFGTGEQPAADAVRQQLSAIADMRVDHRATLYERAQQMRGILAEDQRATLDGMTSQQFMRQMMSQMPMLEMLQMMRSVRGGMMGACRMHGAPMMHRGMMQHGGMGMMQPGRNRPN